MKYLGYIILIIALFGITDTFAQRKAEIVVKGIQVDDLLDSIELDVMVPGGIPLYPNSTKKYRRAWNGQEVKFEVEVYDTPTYFTLVAGRCRIVNSLIESGDNIVIYADPSNTKFEGKNILKNKASYDLMNMNKAISGRLKHSDPSTILEEMELRDSLTLAKIEYLNRFKGDLSKPVYSMMMLDVIGDSYMKSWYLTNSIPKGKLVGFREALKNYVSPTEVLQKNLESQNTRIASLSMIYGLSLVQDYMFHSFFRKDVPFNFNTLFNHFSTFPEGPLKEKILAYLIYHNRKDSQAIASIDKALESVENPVYKETLLNLRGAFNGETSLASYNLFDVNGKSRNLSRFKGNVVVADFWYTGCSACPEVIPYLYQLEESLRGKSVKFISVSIDVDRNKWLKSVASGLYTIDKGLNFHTGASGKMHPLIRDLYITGYPTVLVFDQEGIIAQIPKDPRLDNAQDISRVVEALLLK